jgi:3-oxoacyl-[acyl-carrier-protein] synthase II
VEIILLSYFQVPFNSDQALVYISAASGITHQPTFKNAGFSASLDTISSDTELISPNYKDYIDAGLLRRMSKILRMSVASAKECIQQANDIEPDAIVVGTGLGCLQDTEKFLNTFLSVEGLLPPTSFIQSTHNTIAGQISLSIGNHGYNMTHTQNTLSFEHALIDSIMLLAEGNSHILVGAADEHIPFLDSVVEVLDVTLPVALTSGCSFFVLSKEMSDQTLAKLSAVETYGEIQKLEEHLDHFFEANPINPDALDMVLFSGLDIDACDQVLHYLTSRGVAEDQIQDYLIYSGIYPTASAFAVHYAVDKMATDNTLKNVLICNCLNRKNLGLTLIQSVEA